MNVILFFIFFAPFAIFEALAPPSIKQVFVNSYVMFSAFEAMLSFRTCSLFYKNVEEQRNMERSLHCDRLASYMAIYLSILTPERLYDKQGIPSKFGINFYKSDSKTGRDAYTVARELNKISLLTDELNWIIDPNLVEAQYPLKPLVKWIFDENNEEIELNPSEVIRSKLSRDFYYDGVDDQPPQKEPSGGDSAGKQSLEDIQGLSESFRERLMNVEAGGEGASSSTHVRREEAAGESSETIPRSATAPAAEEHRRPSDAFKASLPRIADKQGTAEHETFSNFYYRQVWTELLGVYSLSYIKAKNFFNYALFQKDPIDDLNAFVPDWSVSLSIWNSVSKLLEIVDKEYTADQRGRLNALQNNPVEILLSVERAKHEIYQDISPTDLAEELLIKNFELQYVNTKKNKIPADIKVIV